MWTETESSAAQKLIDLAFHEDLGDVGDVTSNAVLTEELRGEGIFVGRSAGVVAGLPLVTQVFATISDRVQITPLVEDGTVIFPGQELATIVGPMRTILTGERTALNFLQRLSGIATKTRAYVEAVGGTKAVVLDTRKTTPGWRVLEKYAVRCGGGKNHRMGLYDGVLIKDNHLAALADDQDPIRQAVETARSVTSSRLPIEIEVDNLRQFESALGCQADIVLLDNMSTEDMREAVELRNERAPNVLLEASGGITLERIPEIAATGVDRISIGALTHSAVALDIGLDYRTS
ncbi:MAG: carboxylating nicotinate-nucleotide diphosphorylase [Gemmataceae bacterium]